MLDLKRMSGRQTKFQTPMHSIFSWYFLAMEGRISRREFLPGYIGLVLVDILAVHVGARLFDSGPVYYHGSKPPLDWVGLYVRLAVYLVSAWPFAAILVKRLHDLNITGRWAFAYLAVAPACHALGISYWLPNLLIVVALSAISGSPGDNRFGAAPPRKSV